MHQILSKDNIPTMTFERNPKKWTLNRVAHKYTCFLKTKTMRQFYGSQHPKLLGVNFTELLVGSN